MYYGRVQGMTFPHVSGNVRSFRLARFMLNHLPDFYQPNNQEERPQCLLQSDRPLSMRKGEQRKSLGKDFASAGRLWAKEAKKKNGQ